jgi:hypothetical protein
MDDELLARLLAPPHSLRWQELWGFGDVMEEYVPLLLSLPLRKLRARLAMEHADFFTQLPHLTELRVDSAFTVPLDSARVLQAVGSCSRLWTLSLCGGTKATDLRFSSADLRVCLSRLPHLSDLQLSSAAGLDLLSFLSEVAHFRATLTELCVSDVEPPLPVSELDHVLCLTKLRHLFLMDAFEAPLVGPEEQMLGQRLVRFFHSKSAW